MEIGACHDAVKTLRWIPTISDENQAKCPSLQEHPAPAPPFYPHQASLPSGFFSGSKLPTSSL